jgi:hypothetical protein
VNVGYVTEDWYPSGMGGFETASILEEPWGRNGKEGLAGCRSHKDWGLAGIECQSEARVDGLIELCAGSRCLVISLTLGQWLRIHHLLKRCATRADQMPPGVRLFGKESFTLVGEK